MGVNFAAAQSPRRKPATRKKRSSRRSESAGFNAPSFSAGVIFGAALVLLLSYAPQALEETVVAVREQVSEPTEKIDFEFPDMLENDTVRADLSAYPATFPDEDPNAIPSEYMIQAASLKAYEAASSLSTELRGLGLSASFERVDLEDATWYRIMVGPFPTRVEADRAMTLLRKRNLGPRLIKLS
jgi:cell division septation protein DedD